MTAAPARDRGFDPWAPMRFARSVPLEPSRAAGAYASVQLQRTVLLIIASYADSDGSHANPSVPTIACGAGVDERTARRALRALEMAGLVRTRTGDPRGQRSNRYSLAMERWRRLRAVPDPEPPYEGGADDDVTVLGEAGRQAAAHDASDGADSHDVGPVTSEALPAAEKGGPAEPPGRPPRSRRRRDRDPAQIAPSLGAGCPPTSPVPKDPLLPPHRPQADPQPGPVGEEQVGPAAPGSLPPPAVTAGGSGRPARRSGCSRHPRPAPGCPWCGNRDPLPPNRRAKSAPQRVDHGRYIAELRSQLARRPAKPAPKAREGRPSGQPPARGQGGPR